MAITRLWQSGVESGSEDEFDNSVAVIVGSATVKTGSYSVEIATNNSGRGTVSVPNTRQLQAACFFNNNNYARDSQVWLIAFRDSSNNVVAGVRQNSTNLYLYANGVEQEVLTSENGGNSFVHIAMDINIDSSSGWVYLYKDGSLLASFDGNSGNADILVVAFGSYTATAALGAVTQYFDDMYVDDTTGEGSPTAPRIKRFYPLIPNADGTYSQWTPSTGTSHYELVDERPPDDDTTFLEAITGTLVDSFDMSTFVLDTNEDIVAMIPFVFAKRGSTTELIALGTRSSGTDSIGSDQLLSTNHDYVWERQTTGSLGAPWNQSYMDSVEVIIRSAGTYE